MSYRAVLTMPCSAHGPHEITIRANDVWAILLGLSNLRDLHEAGIPAAISCYKNERELTTGEVGGILRQGADEMSHAHGMPPD